MVSATRSILTGRSLAKHLVWLCLTPALVVHAAEAQPSYSSREHFLSRFASIALRHAENATNSEKTIEAPKRAAEDNSAGAAASSQTPSPTKASPSSSDSPLTTALNLVSSSKLFDSTSLAILGHLGWKSASQFLLADRDQPLPRRVAYVRVSRPFLQRFVERQISHEEPVRDFVLGAKVSGHSSTSGTTEIVFVPDRHHLTAELRLNTAVKFESVADQRPVHIFSRGLTHVEASKRITFDGQNFTVSPASAHGVTQSATTGIASDLRVFNRLSTRIAARKVAEQKVLIDRITAEHTAKQVRNQFEQATAAEVGRIEAALRDQFASLGANPAFSNFRVNCSTTSDVIEVVISCDPQKQNSPLAVPAAVAAAERDLPPSWSKMPSDVEVFVHSGLVARFIRDSALQQAIQPILSDLNERLADAPIAKGSEDETKRPDQTSIAYWQSAAQWSMKDPWYAVSWSTRSKDGAQSAGAVSQQSPAADKVAPKFAATQMAQGD